MASEIAEWQRKSAEFQSENESLKEKLTILERELHSARSQGDERSTATNARLKFLESSLSDAQQELNDWKRKENDLRTDLERESTACAEVETNFLLEIVRNGRKFEFFLCSIEKNSTLK